MRPAGLRLFGRVDRYVGSLFVGAYATSTLLLVGLAVIFDVASNLSFFETWPDGRQAPTTWILRYFALNTPFLYLQIAPFVTTTAALFTVSKLVRHNELVACLNAGISARRVLLSVYLGGLLVAAGMFLMRETATAALGERRDTLYYLLDEHTLVRKVDKVWFRDVAGTVVGIREFYPQTGEVVGLLVVGSRGSAPDSPLVTITADRAVHEPGEDGGAGWRLIGGVLREDTGDTSVQRALDRLELVEFDPRDVLLAAKGQEHALDLSFEELDLLARRDPYNLEDQTRFHSHLTFPLANLVLLRVALPFLFGRERGKNLEGLVLGCLMCVAYFAADFFARSLGMEGALSPLCAGWSALLVFGSLGAVLTDGIRT
jgi:lipopolysaccharide export LptBFGC system permease protein LptF